MARKSISDLHTGTKAITCVAERGGYRLGYITASGHHTIFIPEDGVEWIKSKMSA